MKNSDLSGSVSTLLSLCRTAGQPGLRGGRGIPVRAFKHSSVQIENQTDSQTNKQTFTLFPLTPPQPPVLQRTHFLIVCWLQNHNTPHCPSLLSHWNHALNEINALCCSHVLVRQLFKTIAFLFNSSWVLVSYTQVWCKLIVKAQLKALLS